jgi:uncharacterized protein (DUF3084 family)
VTERLLPVPTSLPNYLLILSTKPSVIKLKTKEFMERKLGLDQREREVEIREKELDERKLAIDQRQKEAEDRWQELDEMQLKIEAVERREKELNDRREEFEKERESWPDMAEWKSSIKRGLNSYLALLPVA